MECCLCPRKCGVDRSVKKGFCGESDKIRIAGSMVHMWEEPPISAENGSGTIFFSGCSLGCVYCQNREISHDGYGKEVSVAELGNIMLNLQNKGVHNINLVTPTHFSNKIRESLDNIRPMLKIPVVYNTSGYELESEILKMSGYVDIFLTDIKYFSPDVSGKYSLAPDYYAYAKKAFSKMLEICPETVFADDGTLKKGVILRHLVLPGQRKDSIALLDDIAKSFDVSKFKLSLMSQYTPDFAPNSFPEIKRQITSFEYQSVAKRAIELGFDGYMQEKTSSTASYTPNFGTLEF